MNPIVESKEIETKKKECKIKDLHLGITKIVVGGTLFTEFMYGVVAMRENGASNQKEKNAQNLISKDFMWSSFHSRTRTEKIKGNV